MTVTGFAVPMPELYAPGHAAYSVFSRRCERKGKIQRGRSERQQRRERRYLREGKDVEQVGQERTKGARVGRIKRKGDNGGEGLLRQEGDGKRKVKLEQRRKRQSKRRV